MIYIKPGEMIGHQNFAEQNGVFMNGKWPYDIYADTYGILAFLPFGDFKFELRKQPLAVSKLMEVSAYYAYETNHFNITGQSPNPAIEFVPQPSI